MTIILSTQLQYVSNIISIIFDGFLYVFSEFTLIHTFSLLKQRFTKSQEKPRVTIFPRNFFLKPITDKLVLQKLVQTDNMISTANEPEDMVQTGISDALYSGQVSAQVNKSRVSPHNRSWLIYQTVLRFVWPEKKREKCFIFIGTRQCLSCHS